MPYPSRSRRWAAALAAGALGAFALAVPCAAASGSDALSSAAMQVGPGSTGPAVVVLQHTLNDWGIASADDGTFTAATAAAVSAAAHQVGISVSDLMAEFAVIGFGPRAMEFGPGQQGPAIAALQRALTRAGYGVEATGVFGPQTEAEVRAFQQAQGLPVTGQITIWAVESAIGTAARTAPAAPAAAAAPAVSSLRQDVANLAASLNGDAYAWGGAGPHAFDCSGLARYVFGAVAGIWLPHSSYLQWLWGRPVPSGYLQPGDLVFFDTDGFGPSHVGIYIGGPAQDFVDATTPSGGVQIDSLYNTYWGSHYVGGRSLLP